MRLSEEYLKRRSVALPLVRHDTNSAVILRTHDPLYWQSRWIVVTIRWRDGGFHPGTFLIEYQYPVHNGFEKGRFFNRYNVKELQWEEYEEYFLSWSQGIHGTTAAGRTDREIVLALWEMFVYCCDGWICKQNPDYRYGLDKSLDTDLSLEQRYLGYQNCLIYLTARHPAVLKAWKYEMLYLARGYAFWLNDLMGG